MATSTPNTFYQTDDRQLEQTVAAAIHQHRLLQGVTRLGIAVSGGADSVALFHLLLPICREQRVAVTLLHLNHGLRVEADEEARFVQTLAANESLPCLTECVNLKERLKDGRSLEMAARDARLAFFRRCITEASLDVIATGHHADDVAETLLLRLARGAGATGLSGLRPCSKVGGCPVIRPLLTTSRQVLRTWLSEKGHGWREDASNRDSTIPRNFVRHTLLPQLEQTWKADLRARLCQSAETLREDDALLDAWAVQCLADMERRMAASDSRQTGGVLLAELLPHPAALQRRILRLWLFHHHMPRAAGVSQVLALLTQCREPGDWQVTLPGNAFAHCEGGVLSIRSVVPVREPLSPATLAVPTIRPLRWGDFEITATLDQGVFTLADGVGRYPAACTLCASSLQGCTLTVRARLPGDRIAPTGMTGSKKIQDLFVDAKIPHTLRDTVPLLVCDGAVVWVPGYRVARRFSVPAPAAPSVRLTIHATG